MRISDDRYTKDRLRYDLAMRLILHEARTSTIRAWTGLSDDRIRKLYRSYAASEPGHSVKRHRGKAPRQAAYFLSTPELRLQSANLAAILCQLGLLDHPAGDDTLSAASRFCEAYEAFRRQHAEPRIGFEHAWFLCHALRRRRELGLGECPACGGLVVMPSFALHPQSCSLCTHGIREPEAALMA